MVARGEEPPLAAVVEDSSFQADGLEVVVLGEGSPGVLAMQELVVAAEATRELARKAELPAGVAVLMGLARRVETAALSQQT